ncbi:chorismate mutase [Micromonospora sp. NPDC051925]|uniref:chorismate mutase n=1 Tax=Micromonospora sp. NPDC051925 TaxID=3364288 RepID=UPI0037C61413
MTDQYHLRAEPDLLDEELLDTLRRRIDRGVHIAKYKEQHDLPVLQPRRVQLVKERAARCAAANGLDAGFLVNLHDAIIGEMCRVEDAVIDWASGDQR